MRLNRLAAGLLGIAALCSAVPLAAQAYIFTNHSDQHEWQLHMLPNSMGKITISKVSGPKGETSLTTKQLPGPKPVTVVVFPPKVQALLWFRPAAPAAEGDPLTAYHRILFRLVDHEGESGRFVYLAEEGEPLYRYEDEDSDDLPGNPDAVEFSELTRIVTFAESRWNSFDLEFAPEEAPAEVATDLAQAAGEERQAQDSKPQRTASMGGASNYGTDAAP